MCVFYQSFFNAFSNDIIRFLEEKYFERKSQLHNHHSFFMIMGLSYKKIYTYNFQWPYDNEHNDTQHNDTQHNDTQHNDTQHNDTQHNDTQRNGTQHNDTQHNDTQHNDTQLNDTQHNDTQHNDNQHNDIQHTDKLRTTLSITIPGILAMLLGCVSFVLMLVTLNVIMSSVAVLDIMVPVKCDF